MRLAEKLKITPFARIILPCCAGIVVAEWIAAPVWLVAVVTVGVYGAAWVFRDGRVVNAYTYGAVFLTGILLAALTRPQHDIPQGERVAIVAEVVSTPVESGRWQRTTASVGFFRPYDDKSPASWQTSRERIQLYVDTCYTVSLGEQLAAVVYLNPVDTTGSRYGALMWSRGITGRAYVVPGRLISRMEAPRRSLVYWSGRMQAWATGRIETLRAAPESRQMSAALVSGYRSGIDRALNTAYSLTGTAHVLSVSGLHMGFVFLIINLLFGWVVLFRRGHLLKNVLVIVALWVYAMLAGAGPSVLRAALMFTAAQIALGTSSWSNSYNIVLGCAMLMLAVNPYYLFDISFQLSFLAVLSILFFYPRLYRGRLGRTRLTDALWSTVLLGVVAQIGTIPLVAYSFGNIPLISVLINPVVVLTAFVIVAAGLCWLLLGMIPGVNLLLNPVLGWITDLTVGVQNGVVRWGAGTPVAAVQHVEMPGWGVWLCYLALAGVALWIKLREEKRERKLSYTITN